MSIFRVHDAFGFIGGEEKPSPHFSSCYISFQIGSEPSFAGKDNNLSGFIMERTIGHEYKNSPTM